MNRCREFRIHTPSSIMMVGPSGSGKTHFTERLLLHKFGFVSISSECHPLLLRIMAGRLSTREKAGHSVSRGYFRVERLSQMVSQRSYIGHGRLDGQRGK